MKTPKTNHIYFEQFDAPARAFYQDHGWVVLKRVIDNEGCQKMHEGWRYLIDRQVEVIGCELQQYLQVICQWRDLWQQQTVFLDVLKAPLANLAASSFELPGCRLLHDHIINKSVTLCNGEVPWHQDSMYWPVDRTGMSTWTALQDTPIANGCLEIADKSHLSQGAAPVDFMRDENVLPQDYDTYLLPVMKGDVVLLHSRTWHRSAACTLKKAERKAHIALWLPQNVGYCRQNAPWHPVNAQVSVADAEVLNNDQFPVFGEVSNSQGNTQSNKRNGPISQKGMFNARKRVAAQIEAIVGEKGTLGSLLKLKENRLKVSDALVTKMAELDYSKAESIVEGLWISAAAYEQTQARNVFGSGYQQWEAVYGEAK